MRYKDIKVVEARIDYHYGLDPELMVYRHKIGDIYGKKNLKVPHAKYSTSKKVKNLFKGSKSTIKSKHSNIRSSISWRYKCR